MLADGSLQCSLFISEWPYVHGSGLSSDILHAETGMEVRDGGAVGGCHPLCTRVLCHLKPDTLLVVGWCGLDFPQIYPDCLNNNNKNKNEYTSEVKWMCVGGYCVSGFSHRRAVNMELRLCLFYVVCRTITELWWIEYQLVWAHFCQKDDIWWLMKHGGNVG